MSTTAHSPIARLDCRSLACRLPSEPPKQKWMTLQLVVAVDDRIPWAGRRCSPTNVLTRLETERAFKNIENGRPAMFHYMIQFQRMWAQSTRLVNLDIFNPRQDRLVGTEVFTSTHKFCMSPTQY